MLRATVLFFFFFFSQASLVPCECVFLSLRSSIIVWWLLRDDSSSARCSRFSSVWWDRLVIRSVVSVYPGLRAVSGPARPELMCLLWRYLLRTEKQWLRRGITSGTAACGQGRQDKHQVHLDSQKGFLSPPVHWFALDPCRHACLPQHAVRHW